MVADGQQRREEQTLCAYNLAELQNEEIKGLFGVKLLAKVYPQKFLMLRETHTRVMDVENIDVSQVPQSLPVNYSLQSQST